MASLLVLKKNSENQVMGVQKLQIENAQSQFKLTMPTSLELDAR
jgi:hypothetical protein